MFFLLGRLDDVYTRLKDMHPRLSVYRLHEVPSDYHFNITGYRMPPILLVADLGWYIVQHRPDTFINKGIQKLFDFSLT